jgi:DNA-binding LacI/PurR family transcriptional regulator
MAFTPPLHRRDGYRDALRSAGIEPDPALETLGFFTTEGGGVACEELLALSEPPSAIFAESDEMAFGALRVLRRAGKRVPTDVAVIGFDDHPLAEVLDLSTMHQPVAAQAFDVTTRLLGAIGTWGEADDSDAHADVVLPTEVIVRGSTDPDRSV